MDRGIVPDGLLKVLAQEEMGQAIVPQTSPQSATSTPSTTPSASPSPAEPSVGHQMSVRQMSAHQTSVQQSRLVSSQPGQPPGQMMGQQQFHAQSSSGVGPSPVLIVGQHHTQTRRQELVRQPSVHHSPQLTSLNRGSRSFEESTRSSSSSSSSMYRSGSVPNLAVSAPQNIQGSSAGPSYTTLVYRDFSKEDNSSLSSTGFIPDLTDLSSAERQAAGGNIPTVVVCNQSPPSGVGQQHGAWTVTSGRGLPLGAGISHMRTLPISSVSSVSRTVQPSASHTQTGVFSDSLVTTGESLGVTSVGPSNSSAVPYYQRPRSSSDLARRVTSSVSPSPSTSMSLSQQNLRDVLDTSVTCYASQDMFSTLTLSDSVAACLNSNPAPQRTTPVCAGSQLNTHTSTLQGLAPVCMGSELSASISEPIPHWYSFLDDLESATLSARQGAFSDAGTPSSSRGRSGAGTPSSVDSPYSQQAQQQQPQQQQQQQQGGGGDGNIPNIITDLLGQPPPS